METKLIEDFMNQYMNSTTWFQKRWYYIEGCILKAYLDNYNFTKNRAYLHFVKSYIDDLIQEDGTVKGLDLTQYNIDQINMGKVLLALNELDQNTVYEQILNDLYKQFETYPTTTKGNLWHKEIYPNQVWLDGLYMGQPFYVRYQQLHHLPINLEWVLDQFENVRKYMFDEDKHLYYHGYDESKKMSWSNKITGLSLNFWGRACGWHVMAMIDILDFIDPDQDAYQRLKSLFIEAIDGLIEYQHPEGMWYQIVDQGNRSGNYLETSGSAMILYSLLKAYRIGILREISYYQVALKCFEGIQNTYLYEKDGEIRLGNICKSAGLGGPTNRSGSYDYYIHTDIVENNGHGSAPFFMAYNEYLMINA